MTRVSPYGAGLMRALLVISLLCGACTHELTVKNLDFYEVPVDLATGDKQLAIAVLPYSGGPDAAFYFYSLIDTLRVSPAFSEVRTHYQAGQEGQFKPSLILSINPQVKYRSSGLNFLINWPGFLIFTPAWNGYVYHADILTQIVIHDGAGKVLSEDTIPIRYSIRQAEMDRTIVAGAGWPTLPIGAIYAFCGGIYNALRFDNDIIGDLQLRVRDNYVNFVAHAVGLKLIAAAGAEGARTPEAGPLAPEAEANAPPPTP